jgi:hypothetical protein
LLLPLFLLLLQTRTSRLCMSEPKAWSASHRDWKYCVYCTWTCNHIRQQEKKRVQQC